MGLHQLLGHLFPSVELHHGSQSSPTHIFIKIHSLVSKSHSLFGSLAPCMTMFTGPNDYYDFWASPLISSQQKSYFRVRMHFSSLALTRLLLCTVKPLWMFQNAAAHLILDQQQKETTRHWEWLYTVLQWFPASGLNLWHSHSTLWISLSQKWRH